MRPTARHTAACMGEVAWYGLQGHGRCCRITLYLDDISQKPERIGQVAPGPKDVDEPLPRVDVGCSQERVDCGQRARRRFYDR